MAAGTVSATFDARQHPGGQDRPGSRSFLDGRVLASADYDDSIRWREGDRLEWLFERRCDWLRRQGRGRHLAVDAMDGTLSYLGLDARANQMARFLVREGVRPGDRIGLLSDRAVDGYLGMLAVLKARAAYVPLDPSYPPDRLSYITSDAGVRMVLSRSHLAERAEPLAGTASLLYLDQRSSGSPGRAGTGSTTARPASPPTTSATSSTPRARPGGRRGSRSSTPASATSSGWRPRCTGCSPGIASTRA